MTEFKPCDHPACNRLVRVGTKYCCAPCAMTHGDRRVHPDGAEPDHSKDCDERAAERMQEALG